MSVSSQIENKVNKLVSATNPEEVKAAYKDWADSYDDDLSGFGYVAPHVGVQLFARAHSDKQGLIHDAGCGTGQVGQLLHAAGFLNIHGSDFSPEMLAVAKNTQCYMRLFNADFGKVLDLPDNHFDAAISIGVYTKRFNDHFLAEMIRTIKPQGHFVFSCRELYFDEVMLTVSDMLKSKSIKNVSIEYSPYMTGQGASAFYIIVQKY